MDEMILAALHVLLAYQGHSFEREEPRYSQQEIQVGYVVKEEDSQTGEVTQRGLGLSVV